jgi:hypothetical protein
MKKIALATIFLAIMTSVVAQDPKCDCTITPFKPSPPCLSHCCTKVLSTSTTEELELILGVQREVAKRIVDWKDREKAKTLDDFEKVLTPKEIKELSGKINSLSEPQLEYFTKSSTERIEVTRTMKNLFTQGAAAAHP